VATTAGGRRRRIPRRRSRRDQVSHRGNSTARFLSISNGPSEGDDIVLYPDSGKVGVYAEEVDELYPRDRAVGYWEGERPPAH
jgi:hypothetical protein